MTLRTSLEEKYRSAAQQIALADGLLIAAGAGMGVDSGLPDFRGTHGFWRAYPALAKAQIQFQDIASPDAFHTDPRRAWGFYGHRLNLYRRTVPHEGFAILRRLGKLPPKGMFVYTSNVDGQFQRAGFSELGIVECHGSIHHLQCLEKCTDDIWLADDLCPEVDEDSCLLTSPFPLCPHCGGLARPNIMLFNDYGWLGDRTMQQSQRLDTWLSGVSKPIILEIGAGTNISTVRQFGESVGGYHIRINPVDLQMTGRATLSIKAGALEALRGIDAATQDSR